MQLGEALGINGTPGVHYYEHAKKPDAATTSFIPGAVDEATLKYAIQKARGG
uniref:hypothetical protein n=1 Tax=Escherichia coli TaxID=562 RepID=UPI001F303F7A|nr:hypothetical protein [Escherichia coli]